MQIALQMSVWEGKLSSCVTILTSVGMASKTCRTQSGDAVAGQAVHGAKLRFDHKLLSLQQQQPTDLRFIIETVASSTANQQSCLRVHELDSALYIQSERHLQLSITQLSKTDWAEQADAVAD